MSDNAEAVTTEEQVTQDTTVLGSEGVGDNLDWKSTLPDDLKMTQLCQTLKILKVLPKL